MIKGSTGSKRDDMEQGSHVVLVKYGVGSPLVEVEIPGTTPRQRVVVDGVSYSHVAEDGDGRWIYR